MSIGMDLFGSCGQFKTYDPYKVEQPQAMVFQLQCRSCGWEVDNSVIAPRACPKCNSKSWERFA